MDSTFALLPLDLGDAAAFDQHVFPLAYYDTGDNLSKGRLLVRATLDEMKKIRALRLDLNENVDFIFNTRVKLEALQAKSASLEDRKTLNPFKAFLNYRATKLFLAGSKATYLQTKRTSEMIQREQMNVQLVSGTQIRKVNDPTPPDAKIVTVAIELPDGWNDAAQQTINEAIQTMATTDPFGDNSLISQLRDDEQVISLDDTANLLGEGTNGSGFDKGNRTLAATSSDLQRSPTGSTHYHFYNSIVTTNSNLTGVTLNRGTQNSGASVSQEPML